LRGCRSKKSSSTSRLSPTLPRCRVYPTLKYLLLPEKAENVEVLKKLPNLLRLSFFFDPKVPGPSKTAAEFWEAWDGDVPCVVALRRDRVKFSSKRQDDGSLSLTIEDPAFNDLGVFRGANLASLTLTGTECQRSHSAGGPAAQESSIEA
jgi:hypothetical protein